MDEYKIVTGGIYLTSPTQGLVGLIDGDQTFNINTFGKKFTITTQGSDAAFTVDSDNKINFSNTTFTIAHTESSTSQPAIIISKGTATFSTGIAIEDSTNIKSGDAYVKTTSDNLVLSSAERTKVLGRLTVYNSSKSLQDGSIGLINSNGNPENMLSLMAPGLENTGVINFINVGQESADRKSSIFYYKNTNALNTNRAGFSLFNGSAFEVDGAGNTYTTGNADVVGNLASSAIYTPNIYINNISFKYSRGSWTPVLRYLRDGLQQPSLPILYDFQVGYYTRCGDTCTVFFDFQFTSQSGSDVYINGAKYVAIGGLPVRIGIQSVDSDLFASSPLTVAEYPDGVAGDLAPAIAAPVYTGGFKVSAYETSYSLPLFINVGVNVNSNPWVADGYHLTISADTTLYGVALAIPPWNVLNQTHAPLSNFHILAGQTYSGCRFAGQITYLTDDPN